MWPFNHQQNVSQKILSCPAGNWLYIIYTYLFSSIKNFVHIVFLIINRINQVFVYFVVHNLIDFYLVEQLFLSYIFDRMFNLWHLLIPFDFAQFLGFRNTITESYCYCLFWGFLNFLKKLLKVEAWNFTCEVRSGLRKYFQIFNMATPIC